MSSRRQLKMTSSTARIVTGLITFSLLIGCNGAQKSKPPVKQLSETDQEYLNSKPDYLKKPYTLLIKEGERNRVLNLVELGKLALKHNDIDEAERAFDHALLQIETVYSDDENATKARSLWHEEGRKDFKGEPYERSMAYFYRGLIYLHKNDFDNARASFLSGLMQDAFAEEDQHRSDFALMIFLAGWASQRMGSEQLANEAYEELKQFRPDFTPPPMSHDTLVIAETGKSPRKLADGLGHYELVYRRGKQFEATRVDLVNADNVNSMYPMEDIFWQASSRGGRPVDSIIEGKAQFMKDSANFGGRLTDVSNTAIIVGGGLGSNAAADIGAAFSLIGVSALAISTKTKPRADTRYWQSLPDLVHIYTYDSSQQPQTDRLIYRNDSGDALFEKEPDLISMTEKQTLLWSANGN